MKQDDIIEVQIIDYGMEGEGIAKADAFTVFVRFAAVGERVKCKVLHVKKNVVHARLIEVLTHSPARTAASCNRFTRCGGCDMMHLSYPEQLHIKRKNLENLFRKNAKREVNIDAVVESPMPLFYRNKIQLPFGTVNGKVAVGFYRENTHKIVSITKCFLHGDWVETLIRVVLEYADRNLLTAYDDNTKTGFLKHLVARYIDGQISIVIVGGGDDLPRQESLKRALDFAFPNAYSLYFSPKPEDSNVVLGKSLKPIVERPFRIDILGIKLTVNPYSFLQLNSGIRDLIYTRIIDALAEESAPFVIDAYAGVGLLGAVLATRGATVRNIELVSEAVHDGVRLAKENGLSDKIKFYEGNAEKLLSIPIKEFLGSQTSKYGSLNIILDPPRKGCSAEVVAALCKLSVPHRIYYISCNPATLTRDIALLSHYDIVSVTPYDMFPQTKHLETLICLEKK